METRRFYGRCEYPGKVTAEAIVAPKYLQGFTNVDPARGFTTERNHPLCRVPYTNKVLVFYSPRGSGGFMRYGYGAKPAALVHTKSSPLTVLLLSQARVPAITDFEEDPTPFIKTGDIIFVNADDGYIEVTTYK
ncbi:MAG: DUF126 domain-containing protein [Oscillospiraceae bacterium]|nr:DUF126 domain-containing protein [Oscillospiraceae bacterium]